MTDRRYKVRGMFFAEPERMQLYKQEKHVETTTATKKVHVELLKKTERRNVM